MVKRFEKKTNTGKKISEMFKEVMKKMKKWKEKANEC